MGVGRGHILYFFGHRKAVKRIPDLFVHAMM
jgi:hypothetical protein